jgi:hypothetical protein
MSAAVPDSDQVKDGLKVAEIVVTWAVQVMARGALLSWPRSVVMGIGKWSDRVSEFCGELAQLFELLLGRVLWIGVDLESCSPPALRGDL